MLPGVTGVTIRRHRDAGDVRAEASLSLPPQVGRTPEPHQIQANIQRYPKRLNINACTAEELANYPYFWGIDEDMANRIVTNRNMYGDYESIEDVRKRTRGFGKVRQEAMKNHVSFSERPHPRYGRRG